jgi:hypothetical protein
VWDATHVPTIAFIPIALCSFVLAAIALTLDFHDHTVWHDAKAD